MRGHTRAGAAKACAAGLSPWCLPPRRDWRCSTARRSRPRWRCRLVRRRRCLRRGARRRRAVGRRRQGQRRAVRCAHPAGARPAGTDRRRGARYRALLAGSEIRARTSTATRVQDPYTLRCQPQVMGACLDLVRHRRARRSSVEANAVTDNPLVFRRDGRGALRRKFPCRAGGASPPISSRWRIAEIGALAERRIALLIDRALAGCRLSWSRDPGINSGFMIAHVTAAALASENKSLAHPASVDSLPTSANQEDHVSMATFARAAPRRHDATTPRPSSPSNCWPRRRASICASPCRPAPSWARR